MRKEPFRLKKPAAADVFDSGGAVTLRLGGPAAGRLWIVERSIFLAGVESGGTLKIGIHSHPGGRTVSDESLEDYREFTITTTEVFRATGEYGGDGLWIASQEQLVVRMTGGVATGNAYAKCKVRELEEEPESVENVSEEEELQEELEVTAERRPLLARR